MVEEQQKSTKAKVARKRNSSRSNRRESQFDQKIIDLARVTRVMAGGKRMRFRATVVIGDRKGTVGVGTAKGADVTIAINKAVTQAKKALVKVPFVNETIIHEVKEKYKASKIMLKPAREGTGIKAGGVVRVILDLAGVPNVVGKILGSKNKINIARAVIKGLSNFKMKASSNTNTKKNIEKSSGAKEDKKVKKVAKKNDK